MSPRTRTAVVFMPALFVVLACCASFSQTARAESVDDALKKLVGTWAVTNAVKDGDGVPQEHAQTMKVIITK